MIYSYTPNPAIDVTGLVQNIIPNEKNYVYDVNYLPGGNGINAGIIAKRLGADVLLRGFLGGSHGERMKGMLEKERIEHSFIQIEHETRMNVTISNMSDHRQTRLSFPGPRISAKEVERFIELNEDVLEHSVIVVGGSLPEGISNAHLEDAIIKWRERNCLVLVDMPSKNLKDLIRYKPDFIKPNLEEFQDVVEKKISSINEVIVEAQKLLHLVPHLCISSVENGALFVTKDEAWFGKIPEVEIQSTVGAGDSMVGAMAFLWNSGRPVEAHELLRIGLAAACATLAKKGSTLGDREDIHNYGPQVLMKKIY